MAGIRTQEEINTLERLVQRLRGQVAELESARREYVSAVLDKTLDRVARKLPGDIILYNRKQQTGFLLGPGNAQVFFNRGSATRGVRDSLEKASGQASPDGYIRFDRSIPVLFEVREVRGEPGHLVAGAIQHRVPRPHGRTYPGGQRLGEVTQPQPDWWRDQGDPP